MFELAKCPNLPHNCIVRAPDNGLLDLGIYSDDLLLVDRAELAAAGQIVVAELNGEPLIRRLAIVDGSFALVPANPQFPLLAVGEGDHLKIWGVVQKRLPAMEIPE